MAKCAGIEQATNSVPLQSYAFPRKAVLLLGNEQSGIPAPLLHHLDVCVEIPTLGGWVLMYCVLPSNDYYFKLLSIAPKRAPLTVILCHTSQAFLYLSCRCDAQHECPCLWRHGVLAVRAAVAVRRGGKNSEETLKVTLVECLPLLCDVTEHSMG